MFPLYAVRSLTSSVKFSYCEMRRALDELLVSQTRLSAASWTPITSGRQLATCAAIARATQNETFVKLIEFLGVRLVPPRNLYLRGQPPEAQRAYVEKVRAEHEAIVDAIVRMNPAGARDAARHHMQESLSRHTELSEAAHLSGSRELTI